MAKANKISEEDRLYKVIQEQQAQLVRVWTFLSCLRVDAQTQGLISRFMTGESLGRGLLAKEKDLNAPKGP